MQISKKTLVKWRKLRDSGDNRKLATELNLDEATISKILAGKSETTSDVLLKIKDFFKRKKAILAKIEND